MAYEVTASESRDIDYATRLSPYQDPATGRRKLRWNYVGVVEGEQVRRSQNPAAAQTNLARRYR